MEQHSWSEADDLIAFYLFKFGTKQLSLDLSAIAKRQGISPGSMDMRVRNFKAYAGTGQLNNISKQSVRVFEKYKNTPEPELRSQAFPAPAQGV